jgi:hypothetical protein
VGQSFKRYADTCIVDLETNHIGPMPAPNEHPSASGRVPQCIANEIAPDRNEQDGRAHDTTVMDKYAQLDPGLPCPLCMLSCERLEHGFQFD